MVKQQSHSVCLQTGREKTLKFFLGSEFGIDSGGGSVTLVSVGPLPRAGLKDRRRIQIRDAQFVKVGDDSASASKKAMPAFICTR